MVTGNSPGHGPGVTQFSLWNEKPPNIYLARHHHEFCVVCRGGIRKGDIFVADAEELKNVDASEVHRRRLNAEEVLMPKKREEFVVLSQMDQSSWPEETRYSEHPPQFRNTVHEVRSTTMFFKESRTGLNHQTTNRMTLKPEMTGVSLGHIFVISFNQDSNSCAK